MATLARRENFKLLHPRELSSYNHAEQRCNNPNEKQYPNYGGRGIKFCFNSFREFYEHIGERSENTTLERLDNEGNYELGNVAWETAKEQARNTRSNINLTFDGKTQCMAAWAEEIGVHRRTLWYRLDKGWSVERALTTPLNKRFSHPS